MKDFTNDRTIWDSMRKTPEYHIKMAGKMKKKLLDKLKKPGITREDEARIQRKIKWLERIAQKFKSGEGLSDERRIK